MDNSYEILKKFQLTTDSIEDKSSDDFGLSVSKFISSTVYAGQGGYYFERNARFRKNRDIANGRMDVKAKFQDRFDFDGKQNYLNIGWQAIQIVNRIITGLVGRWMERNEKIRVTAIDSISVKAKKDEFEQLEFYIDYREKLQAMQDATDVQFVPQGDNLPQDKNDLLLWQSQLQRLPEEILNEIGINDILEANGVFTVVKEKMLTDAAEVGLVCKYVWMDKEGVIHTEYVKPENSFYSYSEYPDFRDTTWRGEAPTLKISQIRKDYGKEFNPNNPRALSERDLWEIAATSKDYQLSDNITWLDQWATAYLRPYDECNVNAIRFELKSVDKEKVTVTKTKTSGSTIIEKGLPRTSNGNLRAKPLDNQEVIEDTNVNIYRGVYLPQSEKLLEWGVKKNMIRPQDPKEIGNAEFSYSFYMYQNYKMRNIAIPEKIEQPVDGMILALLKIEQLVSKMTPIGAAINVDALQNIDYGLGDKKNKDVDYKRLYNQTGDIYYRGKDDEGNPIPVPIQELTNSGFLPQMQGLMQLYQFHYGTLKDQLGEDPNLLQQALQPRVTASNVNVSQRQAEYSTEYMYRAYAEVVKDEAKKISCLLKNSVTYGSKAYRKLLNEDDVQDRIFSTEFQLLPDQNEIAALDLRMMKVIDSTPDAIQFINTSKILRIAQQDVKLAEEYYHQCMKKMLETKQAQAVQNQEATFKAQHDSAVTAETEKRKTMKDEVTMKGQIEAIISKEKQKEIILTGIFGMREKGVDLGGWGGVEQEMIKNVGIPLFAENQATEEAMANQEGNEEQQEGMANEEQIQSQQQEEIAA